jgi:ABC-type cobalamin/Fe3+-siderophores transport system ATPase subunit
MSTETLDKKLHLPSLEIKGFRGIANLSIPRLGRVTLIAGVNGVGKTTLLEAIRVYAARGSHAVLASILGNREELTSILDEDGDEVSVPDLESLFFGRHPKADSYISIGPVEDKRTLSIRFAPGPWQQGVPFSEGFADTEEPLLTVEFQGTTERVLAGHLLRSQRLRRMPPSIRRRIQESVVVEPIKCESSGPSLMDNESMARFWDRVALTDYETQAVEALQLVYGKEVDRVAMVGDEENRFPQKLYRKAVVKMNGQERPVPLKSLGDGAVRIFGIALAIANSQDGFLVIDEAENGIHYTVQPAFWKMVMQSAYANNVQVIATTHSWDCIVGFAQAAVQLEGVEGVLFRIDRFDDWMRAVEYNEDDLQVAARQRIEVR